MKKRMIECFLGTMNTLRFSKSEQNEYLTGMIVMMEAAGIRVYGILNGCNMADINGFIINDVYYLWNERLAVYVKMEESA